MHHLVALNQTLRAAGTMLDTAAGQIRDGRLEPVRQNITKIGEALALIFELQDQIYRQAPELNLEPQYEEVPEEERKANRRLGEAMLAADDLATSGKLAEARQYLADYAASEASDKHSTLARRQIHRYHAPGDA
jgi:hypothetical protein